MRFDDSADEADALAGRAKTTSAAFYTTLNHLQINMLNHGLISE